MVLETPLLRVSRPVAACSRCRAAKVKCDGKLPACTACEKANKADECSSTNDQFARGKERSYVATLEARVEKLEKKIEEAKARRQSSLTMLDYDPASTPRKLSTDTIKRPVESKRAARRRELFNIDSLVSDFGLLSVPLTVLLRKKYTYHHIVVLSTQPQETSMASLPRCHTRGYCCLLARKNHYRQALSSSFLRDTRQRR